jgi:hypothetical protein
LSLAVFVWNSNAIVNNLIVGDGYGHVVIGGVINLGILFWFPIGMLRLSEKCNFPTFNFKYLYAFIGVGVLVIAFIMAGFVFGGSGKIGKAYEEQACEMVSEILERNLGEDAAKCKNVKFIDHPTSTYWKGEAYLDNANSLKIGFTRNGDSVYVNILDW